MQHGTSCNTHGRELSGVPALFLFFSGFRGIALKARSRKPCGTEIVGLTIVKHIMEAHKGVVNGEQ
ncbi:MAG: cell wall metabolism sensor histidine kinase WalK [Proteobacteria bacterium]|nr:cell wall metabolism sensor histidine kinase WalK [Pseudomonadota bacterium]MBU4469999.1 cell wall metabolism sensor histidine kinase WalK [Pseudomonadota bacterium]MCG2753780.1 cell wall metabolism sensor histidine kinase WalK [Desulfobacteraceae bacterium]